MKPKKSYIIITFLVALAFLGFMLRVKHLNKKARLDRKIQLVNAFKDAIQEAQRTGHLDAFLLVWPVHPQDLSPSEMFSMLRGTRGIETLRHYGSWDSQFDENVVRNIASMPDLANLILMRTQLLDSGIFTHLREAAKIERIELRYCTVSLGGYKGLSHSKNIKELAIISPLSERMLQARLSWREPAPMKKEEVTLIVEELCEMKGLRKIVLDECFLPWNENLRQSMPETEIVFAKVGEYDIETEILGCPCPCSETVQPAENAGRNAESGREMSDE